MSPTAQTSFGLLPQTARRVTAARVSTSAHVIAALPGAFVP
ncbi:hypothetical protein [Labilithrix luteola]|nr:hypothetical protein [Labilithrix luteola]